jgi:hypothetical protein
MPHAWPSFHNYNIISDIVYKMLISMVKYLWSAKYADMINNFSRRPGGEKLFRMKQYFGREIFKINSLIPRLKCHLKVKWLQNLYIGVRILYPTILYLLLICCWVKCPYSNTILYHLLYELSIHELSLPSCRYPSCRYPSCRYRVVVTELSLPSCHYRKAYQRCTNYYNSICLLLLGTIFVHREL